MNDYFEIRSYKEEHSFVFEQVNKAHNFTKLTKECKQTVSQISQMFWSNREMNNSNKSLHIKRTSKKKYFSLDFIQYSLKNFLNRGFNRRSKQYKNNSRTQQIP